MCGPHAKKIADELYSLIVRTRAGRCASCSIPGRPDAEGRPVLGLQCAHIVTRGKLATRYTDAVALCAGCHKRFTHDPPAWDDWCISYFGAERYAAIKRAAQIQARHDLGMIVLALRQELRELAA
jgi:hypothetical protein